MKSTITALIMSAFLPLAISIATAQPIAFTNVTVIDVREGIAKPAMSVIVTGDRITAVEPVDEIDVPLYIAHGIGAFPGFGLHEEMESLVRAGLTPAEALRAANLEPARYLEATDTLGTVEPGKLADLVLLDANPLEDIINTQKIRAVVANGRYFDRQALDDLLQEAKKAANPQEDNNP